MPTRKKGGAVKTKRPRKPTGDTLYQEPANEIATNEAANSEGEVFYDIMLLLDKVDPAKRTDIIAAVISALHKSKADALKKAQKDYDSFTSFVNSNVMEQPTDITGDADSLDESATGTKSKYE